MPPTGAVEADDGGGIDEPPAAPWEDEGHGVGMVPMAARVQVLVLVTVLPRPYPQPARLAPSTARPSTTAFGEPGTSL